MLCIENTMSDRKRPKADIQVVSGAVLEPLQMSWLLNKPHIFLRNIQYLLVLTSPPV